MVFWWPKGPAIAWVQFNDSMPPSRRRHQRLNRQSATGAHERVEI
jgi:hypothetical protein